MGSLVAFKGVTEDAKPPSLDFLRQHFKLCNGTGIIHSAEIYVCNVVAIGTELRLAAESVYNTLSVSSPPGCRHWHCTQADDKCCIRQDRRIITARLSHSG